MLISFVSCCFFLQKSIDSWTGNRISKMGYGLILLLILYIIWDVNYFIRCLFTVAMGRLFQRKRKISETTTIYGNANACRLPCFGWMFMGVFLSLLTLDRIVHVTGCGYLHSPHEQCPIFTRTGLRPLPLLRINRFVWRRSQEQRWSSAGRLQCALSQDHSDFQPIQNRNEARVVGWEGDLFGTKIHHIVRWIRSRHCHVQAVHHQLQRGGIDQRFSRRWKNPRPTTGIAIVVSILTFIGIFATERNYISICRLNAIEVSSEKLRKEKKSS